MGAILRPYPNLLRGAGLQIAPIGGIPHIDWTHPLTVGLVHYAFNIGPHYIDLVSGNIFVKDPSTSLVNVIQGSPFGQALTFNVGAVAQVIAGVGDAAVARNQVWNAPYSYMLGIRHTAAPTGTTSAANLWGVCDASNNTPIAMGSSSTTQTVFEFGNTSTVNAYNPATSIGLFRVCVGVATSSGNATCYVNGSSVGTLSAGTTNFTGTACHWAFNTQGWTASNSNTVNYNAQIFFSGAWQNRALNQQEALLLYNDPYCFLLPAEYEMPALFKAAVAAVVQSFKQRNIIRASARGFR